MAKISLKTRLKYIKMTLEVDFSKNIFRGGPGGREARNFFLASHANSLNIDYFRGWPKKISSALRAHLPNTDLLAQ